MLKNQKRLATFLIFEAKTIFNTMNADNRCDPANPGNQALDMAFIFGCFAPKYDFDAASRGAFRLKGDTEERQVLFLLLRTNFADNLQFGRAKLISVCEVVKKTLPTVLFYETGHLSPPTNCFD